MTRDTCRQRQTHVDTQLRVSEDLNRKLDNIDQIFKILQFISIAAMGEYVLRSLSLFIFLCSFLFAMSMSILFSVNECLGVYVYLFI